MGLLIYFAAEMFQSSETVQKRTKVGGRFFLLQISGPCEHLFLGIDSRLHRHQFGIKAISKFSVHGFTAPVGQSFSRCKQALQIAIRATRDRNRPLSEPTFW
jgi:hypothetical protein